MADYTSQQVALHCRANSNAILDYVKLKFTHIFGNVLRTILLLPKFHSLDFFFQQIKTVWIFNRFTNGRFVSNGLNHCKQKLKKKKCH